MSKMLEELQEGISRLSAENTRLKELNREMVEGLNTINNVTDGRHFQIEYGGMVQLKRIIKSVLAKAEGEGE